MSDLMCQTVPLSALMHRESRFVPAAPHPAAAITAAPAPDEYARGLADGQQVAAAAFEADRTALQKLLADANVLQPDTSAELAALIGETVVRLVEQVVGSVDVDRRFLEKQIARAVAFITEADAARTIWLNPADHALLSGAAIGMDMKADPDLPRGTLRIDCSDSWIEHGTALGIEKLRALLCCEGAQP